MKPDNHIPQIFAIQMRVYLSGKNGFMSQHFLNGPQISTSFNQMCCKGMPEGVGTDLSF